MPGDTRPCPTCGITMTRTRCFPKFCSEDCRPRCAVDGCQNPMRKLTWCSGHYQQQRDSGAPPGPFKHRWSKRIPCLNCDASTDNSKHRKFCTDACRVAFAIYGGPRPTHVNCVACGTEVSLLTRGKRGQRRKSCVKFCNPCRQDYDKYKMTARELAVRDGTDCGICGTTVDMTLPLSGDLMRPSVDHILARANGGTHDPDNLQLAHLQCNMRKSNRAMPVT